MTARRPSPVPPSPGVSSTSATADASPSTHSFTDQLLSAVGVARSPPSRSFPQSSSLSSTNPSFLTRHPFTSAIAATDAVESLYGSAAPNTVSSPLPILGVQGLWPVLCGKMVPVFAGQPLAGYVEEIQEYLLLWMSEVTPAIMASEITTFVQNGLQELARRLAETCGAMNTSSSSSIKNDPEAGTVILSVWAEGWRGFIGHCVPYLEGCFLPFKKDWDVRERGGVEVPVHIRSLCLRLYWQVVCWPVRSTLIDVVERSLPQSASVTRDLLRVLQCLSLVKPAVMRLLPPVGVLASTGSPEREQLDGLVRLFGAVTTRLHLPAPPSSVDSLLISHQNSTAPGSSFAVIIS